MGLSNEQIGERLFLSVSTVKGHNLRIFDKLQVKRRTEAVATAVRRDGAQLTPPGPTRYRGAATKVRTATC